MPSIVDQVREEVVNEYRKKDPGVSVTLERLDEVPQEAVKAKTSAAFMESLYLTPHGPQAMSADFEGIVETSNNLAIVSLKDEKLSAVSSTRSLVESARNECAYTVAAAAEDFGLKVRFEGAYPSWEPDPDSALVKKTASLYKAFFKKKPVVTTIHAGLECGLFSEKYPGMDMVSYGPTMRGVHSPDERLELSTVTRFWELTKEILKRI